VLTSWGIADVAMPQPGPQLLSYAMRDPQCVKAHRPMEKKEKRLGSEMWAKQGTCHPVLCSHLVLRADAGLYAVGLVRWPVTNATGGLGGCW